MSSRQNTLDRPTFLRAGSPFPFPFPSHFLSSERKNKKRKKGKKGKRKGSISLEILHMRTRYRQMYVEKGESPDVEKGEVRTHTCTGWNTRALAKYFRTRLLQTLAPLWREDQSLIGPFVYEFLSMCNKSDSWERNNVSNSALMRKDADLDGNGGVVVGEGTPVSFFLYESTIIIADQKHTQKLVIIWKRKTTGRNLLRDFCDVQQRYCKHLFQMTTVHYFYKLADKNTLSEGGRLRRSEDEKEAIWMSTSGFRKS